jgi:hypothetical protein
VIDACANNDEGRITSKASTNSIRFNNCMETPFDVGSLE